jgi:hypothetical protein
MFGIERRRRQAGSCWLRSARPDATSRAARTSAIERFGGEPAGVQLGGRAARQPLGGRRGAQRAAAGRSPVPAHDPPLDRRGAARLDQLLADRPGERLEWLRPAPRAQPGRAADHGPDERVPAKAAVELAQVVVRAQREAHALDGYGAGFTRLALRNHSHCFRSRPGTHDNLLIAQP